MLTSRPGQPLRRRGGDEEEGVSRRSSAASQRYNQSGGRALFCGCEWAPSPPAEMWTDIRALLLFHLLALGLHLSEGQCLLFFYPVCDWARAWRETPNINGVCVCVSRGLKDKPNHFAVLNDALLVFKRARAPGVNGRGLGVEGLRVCHVLCCISGSSRSSPDGIFVYSRRRRTVIGGRRPSSAAGAVVSTAAFNKLDQ